MKLKDKNIVLCITGGIAAYKAVYLASFLKKQGANVFPVLTKNALKFITPLTLKTITRNKVTIDMFDESDFIPHISLAELADIILVAPASANMIAKAAHGIADDMTSTLLLSTKAIKIIVPAMNANMYLNTITQENINKLKNNNFKLMTPEAGNLACGTEGVGRFPEIETIYAYILQNFEDDKKSFKNKNVLITLGGTIEDIDPVRYISNRSSGKMGFAFAEEFIYRGANITIIAGNTSDLALHNFKNKFPLVNIINVRSAKEMYEKVNLLNKDFDIYLMAAAVADYTTNYNSSKIKKNDENLILNLNKTDDILKNLIKQKNAIYIGFAAETDDLLKNARRKLISKQLDFIIANNVGGINSAIGQDKAEVFLLNKWNELEYKFDCNNKDKIANLVLEKIILCLDTYNQVVN